VGSRGSGALTKRPRCESSWAQGVPATRVERVLLWREPGKEREKQRVRLASKRRQDDRQRRHQKGFSSVASNGARVKIWAGRGEGETSAMKGHFGKFAVEGVASWQKTVDGKEEGASRLSGVGRTGKYRSHIKTVGRSRSSPESKPA